jgi:8-oxo-dGTP pyrophosphatase MutT (NUDIX family)
MLYFINLLNFFEGTYMKYEKSCGAVVVKRDQNEDYFLLVQMNKGHWSFPKGHMQHHETEQQTALREIKEETNLDVILLENFRQTVKYHSAHETEKEVVYFLAKSKSDYIQRQESEIKNISWLRYEDAMGQLTYETDKGILKQVHAMNFL